MSDQTPMELIELGKAIPPTAWERATNTACDTFEKCLAPLTEATSGVGRLIKAKFDRLTELEQINSAAAFQRAREKLDASGRAPVKEIEPKVLVASLEGVALEMDEDMRELWANLIAQEFMTGGIHPLIPEILRKLTPEDAHTLAKIEETDGRRFVLSLFRRDLTSNPGGGRVLRTFSPFGRRSESVSQAALSALGLIQTENEGSALTTLGRAFIQAVKDPSGDKGASVT